MIIGIKNNRLHFSLFSCIYLFAFFSGCMSDSLLPNDGFKERVLLPIWTEDESFVGLIDLNGDTVLPLKYKSIQDVNDNQIAVGTDSFMYLLDVNTLCVISCLRMPNKRKYRDTTFHHPSYFYEDESDSTFGVLPLYRTKKKDLYYKWYMDGREGYYVLEDGDTLKEVFSSYGCSVAIPGDGKIVFKNDSCWGYYDLIQDKYVTSPKPMEIHFFQKPYDRFCRYYSNRLYILYDSVLFNPRRNYNFVEVYDEKLQLLEKDWDFLKAIYGNGRALLVGNLTGGEDGEEIVYRYIDNKGNTIWKSGPTHSKKNKNKMNIGIGFVAVDDVLFFHRSIFYDTLRIKSFRY